MHPAFLAGVRADDPVLPVERQARAEHLVVEVGEHRLAVVRMDERDPAPYRPYEHGIDTEDRIEALRAPPASGRDVERERADPRDRLHLVEQAAGGWRALTRRAGPSAAIPAGVAHGPPWHRRRTSLLSPPARREWDTGPGRGRRWPVTDTGERSVDRCAATPRRASGRWGALRHGTDRSAGTAEGHGGRPGGPGHRQGRPGIETRRRVLRTAPGPLPSSDDDQLRRLGVGDSLA